MKPYETPEIQAKLAIIKDAVLAAAPDAEAIYLFGSYAYGTPNEDSDIDVYVVVPDSEPRRHHDIGVDVLKRLWDCMDFPLDLLVQSRQVFDYRRALPTMHRTIANEGVRIYG